MINRKTIATEKLPFQLSFTSVKGPFFTAAACPFYILGEAGLHSAAASSFDSRARGSGFYTRSGHILLFLLRLIQERQLTVSYLRKCVHEVLVKCIEGLSLPRKSEVRLTDCPDMTIAVYCGRNTTTTTILGETMQCIKR